MTSLANPMALKTKKTPSRKRRNDLGESVFQNVSFLLIKGAARSRILPQRPESRALFSLALAGAQLPPAL
jgi:hypothetical protein